MTPAGGDLSRRAFIGGLTAAAALGRSTRLGGAQVAPSLSLLPFLSRPRTDSILVSVRSGTVDARLRLEVKAPGPAPWSRAGSELEARAGEFGSWTVRGLEPGTSYDYRVVAAGSEGAPESVATGGFTTQRVGEETFSAVLMTDAHTGSFVEESGPMRVFDGVIRNARADRPDFVLALGDNVAWYTSREYAQQDDGGATWSYTMYRQHMEPLTTRCSHFGLIGNWEGETGKVPDASAALMAGVRHRFTPGPDDRTYPQGGSANEDYYAFAWGPALFVVLNVQSYTTPSGALGSPMDDVSRVEDWTLGGPQFAWMEGVLTASDHPYKFVCIHHVVGGNAATQVESLYGRGGPRAALVGEQRLLHELMAEVGVQIFFFGHDHVFLDEVVDGIHYAMPGSCGAPWKFGTEVTGYRRYWPDSGHGRLTVRPERATVEFVNVAGEVIHRFEVAPG